MHFRYFYAAGLLILFFPGIARSTQIVVKVRDNAIVVAADTKAQEKDGNGNISEEWAVCKIQSLGGGIYFSHSGRRGGTHYDVNAVAVQSRSRTVFSTAARFEELIRPLMDSYHRTFVQTSPAGDWGWDDMLFYGFDNGKPTCLRKTFIYSTQNTAQAGVINLSCPPSCEPFISAPNDGASLLLKWANAHPAVYKLRPEKLVGCLVRAAIPLAHGVVGGAVPIATIDTHGALHWIEKAGCPDGAHESDIHYPLAPDPPPCDLTEK